MAEADFTLMTNSLSVASIDRAVTAGVARPNGGGSFVYGFNALDDTEGAAALLYNPVNFAPMAKGGSISAAFKRAGSGPTNFAPFIFIGAQSALVSASGYLLGLSDEEASRIQLRKGALNVGMPNGDITTPPTNGLLAQSTDTYAPSTYVHVKIDMIYNTNGDIVLNCYQNDLDANPVTAPVWTAIPGISQFIDDALGVNSGSAPFTNGRVGFGFYKKATGRQAFFDYLVISRQT